MYTIVSREHYLINDCLIKCFNETHCDLLSIHPLPSVNFTNNNLYQLGVSDPKTVSLVK